MMPNSDFKPVGKSRPCPICGKSSNCSWFKGHMAYCRRADRLEGGPPAGWTRQGETGKDGGAVFVPDGHEYDGPAKLDPQIERERSERAAEAEKRKKATARKCWTEAKGQSIDPVRRYLIARGIEIGKLPGGKVPPAIRFDARCRDLWEKRQAKGRWRRWPAMVCCVTDGNKRPSVIGVHRTFLEGLEGTPRKRANPDDDPDLSAKKQLGPTNGGSIRLNSDCSSGVLILAEGVETALACLQATGAAVLCCMDAIKLMNVEIPLQMTGRGMDGAAVAVVIAADLDRSRTGEEKAKVLANRLRGKFPHLTVQVRPPTALEAPELVAVETGERGQDVYSPIEGKGVDWLDVLNRCGEEAVRKGLLDGLDLAEARRRAGEAAVADGPRNASEAIQLSPEARVLDDDPYGRARRFLMDMEAPEPEARAGSTFWLRHWQESWWAWTGKVWEERAELAIHDRIGRWLSRHCRMGRWGPVPLNPTTSSTRDVLKAVRAYVDVDSPDMPCWLAPQFNAKGAPLWKQGDDRWRRRRQSADERLPTVFSNCMLDMHAWAERGEVVDRPHDPLFFNRVAMGYEFPVEAFRRAVAEGREDELAGELCPRWLGVLDHAAEDDLPWRDALQEWYGYNYFADNSLQKFALFVGVPGTAKGTVIRTLGHALGGQGNYASPTMTELGNPFGLAQLVGVNCVLMGDVHIGRWTDTTLAVEAIKSITGNDAVSINPKGRAAFTTTLNCRFTMAANEIPRLGDSSLGLFRRMLVFRMDRKVEQPDRSIEPRIVAGELPGIAAWAMVGLRRLWSRVDGDGRPLREILEPGSSAALKEEIRREQSPMAAFVDDRCVLGDEQRTERQELYDHWKAWCEDNGRPPGSSAHFSRLLRAYLGSKLKDERPRIGEERVRYWVGIAPFASDEAEEADTPLIPA